MAIWSVPALWMALVPFSAPIAWALVVKFTFITPVAWLLKVKSPKLLPMFPAVQLMVPALLKAVPPVSSRLLVEEKVDEPLSWTVMPPPRDPPLHASGPAMVRVLSAAPVIVPALWVSPWMETLPSRVTT